MAAKSAYWELLRRPEWQEKRLRIMDRAGFKCEECGDNETTLNVHHKYYTKGANPWEYPDDALACLCETCHEERHASDAAFKENLSRLGTADVSAVHGFAKGLLLCRMALSDPNAVVKHDSPWEISGILMAYGITKTPHVWHYFIARTPEGMVRHGLLSEMYSLERMGTLEKIAQAEYELRYGRTA